LTRTRDLGVKLVEVTAAQVEALREGNDLGLATAAGWPHDDTLAALGFVRSGGAQFLVVDDDGRIAGECGTKTPPRPDGGVEIGYGLAPSSRAQGLGTRAVEELIRRLRKRPQVSYVEAEVHETNVASRRLVERLGFTEHSGPDHGYLRYRLPLRPG
jgi:ribosomal-protein-alanine N-acetyltransferase